MKTFTYSIITSVLALGSVAWSQGFAALFTAMLLAIIEISLSFDNAILNAAVLKKMEKKWQDRFLSWGILIAVVGVRVLAPILIICFATQLSVVDALQLATHQPEVYKQHILASHGYIAAFGGFFLMMVFLSFMLDPHKAHHWLGRTEKKVGTLGEIQSFKAFTILFLLMPFSWHYISHNPKLILCALSGVITYYLLEKLTTIISPPTSRPSLPQVKLGLSGFIYLEVLDASFSLDGVVAAFAITDHIFIIMVGLGIGSLFIRNITMYLMHHNVLSRYRYLEHGAHYAIGNLACIMLLSMHMHISEWYTGISSALIIIMSVISSIKKVEN